MWEAIILVAIQKLESSLVERPSIKTYDEQILKEVINELRMMLDFFKNKESGEMSRLSYLLADFAEMAQDSADLTQDIGRYHFYDEMANNLDGLRKTKESIMKFGVGKGVTKQQSIGEGDESVVVGLEEDVQQLISRAILNKEMGLVISCIKGMGGVGKTTLAKQIYNHSAIIKKFKRRLWVSVSSDTSIHEVLMKLLQKLVEPLSVEEMDNRSLRQMLCQHLQGIPYFIVIDNLHAKVSFESFLIGLEHEVHGSRLLLTSRYDISSSYLYYTHEMEGLDSSKSRQLFLNTLFHGNKFTSDENEFYFEGNVKEMLKECGGLPLAIIDVGRKIAKQRLAGIKWEKLFDSVDLGESLNLLEEMYSVKNYMLTDD